MDNIKEILINCADQTSEDVKSIETISDSSEKSFFDQANSFVSNFIEEDNIAWEPDENTCQKEMVNHPSHYNHGKYECIDVIEDLQLNFNLGSVLKYIWRLGFKDSEIQELEKAEFYIKREIERRKKKEF